MYIKPFYIVVSPVGSKFAKDLQRQLKNKVTNKVYRRLFPRRNRACFVVTSRPLNKIEQFKKFTDANVSCPLWTTDINALNTLGTKTIFARTLINSTNGRGIIEFNIKDDNIPIAPLYTAYIPKKAEYRFHVFNGEIIDVQQKKKKRDFDEQRDTRIRNLHNGYIYCRDSITLPADASDLAISAVRAVSYQYGAVDIVYNEKKNKCFVLEVNSRPGLMGTTLETYVNSLINTYTLRKKL